MMSAGGDSVAAAATRQARAADFVVIQLQAPSKKHGRRDDALSYLVAAATALALTSVCM